jgi:hypothetical protein
MRFLFWGWSSWRRRAPKHWVFFDLDDTLFILADPGQENYYDSFPHLTKIVTEPDGSSVYMIHFEHTRQLFHDLLEIPNVRIGFITAASYNRQNVLSFLEQVFELKPNSLKPAIYINCNRYGNGDTPKGKKLKKLKRRSILNPEDTVLLVDDNKNHLESAKEHNFATTHATGFFRERSPDNSIIALRDTAGAYLDDVLCTVRRQIIEAELAKHPHTKPEFVVTHAVLISPIVVRPELGL